MLAGRLGDWQAEGQKLLEQVNQALNEGTPLRIQGSNSKAMLGNPVAGEVLDTRNHRATVAGQALTLTSHEYRVLAYLMHHPDQIISRNDLVEHLYAQDFDRDSNTVEVFIGRLRKKLPPGLIETVRGLGYRLTSPP